PLFGALVFPRSARSGLRPGCAISVAVSFVPELVDARQHLRVERACLRLYAAQDLQADAHLRAPKAQVLQQLLVRGIRVEDVPRQRVVDGRGAIDERLVRARTLAPAILPDVFLHRIRRQAADADAVL